MDRRALLLATGAIATATLAGCLGDTENPSDSDGDDSDRSDSGQANRNPPDLSGEPNANPDIPEAQLREVARDNAAFAVDLYRELASDPHENVFLSPYSISVALAMTYAGASGQTADEMEAVLHFTDGQDVHPAFAGLQHALAERATTEDLAFGDEDPETVDAFELNVANALWAREGIELAEAFQSLVADYYGAGVAEADFIGDPDGERERINAWIADQTEDRIDELLPPGAIDPQTVLVLTNAIYFLASWESEFDPEVTVDDGFRTAAGDEVTVPFMRQELRTDYAETHGARAIELKYVGGDVSMVLILPEEGTFETFEADLDADALFEIFDALSDHTGSLALPQFEIETEFELSTPLIDLGMPTPFGDGADFSEMFANGGAGVAIDEVYHDAFITIDEEGTEAAAATAVVMDESAPPSWGQLRFDRPFLFCIRDRPTDSVLFLGRVTDPIP